MAIESLGSAATAATTGGEPHGPTPPHPVIERYYRSAAERPEAVRKLFDDSAAAYDRITGFMSFGTGARYRREVLERIGVSRGDTVVDVACGTGQVSAAARALVGPTGTVVGIDPSPGMRAVAAQRRGIAVQAGTAEAIPLPDESADFITMGYALRHVSDLVEAFREMRRVLRPGGTVCALEITAPTNRAARAALRFYLRTIVPPASLLVTSNRQAARLMSYYWDTIEQCVPPERILDAMRRAGLEAPRQSISLGILREYVASRGPARGARRPGPRAQRVLDGRGPALTRVARAFARHTQRRRIDLHLLHGERLREHERAILAVTHLGNLEPFFVSLQRESPIHWMTRIEFYKYRPAAWSLRKFMTFSVHRQGVPASTIRCGLELLDDHRTVGIFPEGGVARGADSMLNGGRPRGGACVLALRSGAPIVPVAVAGVPALSAVRPWLPVFPKAPVWIAVGPPLEPARDVTRANRRRLRHEMTDRLGAAFVELRDEMRADMRRAGGPTVPTE